MLKTSRDKQKLNVRWNVEEANQVQTIQKNHIDHIEQNKSNINNNIKEKLLQVKPEQYQGKETNQLKITNDKEDEGTAAQTALDKARAALEAAKMAIDAMHAPQGRYINWDNKHAELAANSWCCIGDLMAFCDKYEFKSISRTDARLQHTIVNQVKALLNGAAPFGLRQRFPGNIRNPENLWVCIGLCAGIEYHLNRIMNIFRKPLEQLSTDKQRMARQNFHLAVNELRLDISARILNLRLYDCNIFERDFKLNWQNDDNDNDEK